MTFKFIKSLKNTFSSSNKQELNFKGSKRRPDYKKIVSRWNKKVEKLENKKKDVIIDKYQYDK